MALQLPPLPEFEPRWEAMMTWWQQVKEAIERNEEAQQILFDQIDTALGAGADGSGITPRLAILGSFPIPTMILTGSDAGATATISIAAHVRHYGDGTEVAVAAGSVTSLAFSTVYGVYYDDATLADSVPTFEATTDLETAQHNYSPGRHYVGTITTPANGAGNTTGGAPPAGSGYTAGQGSVVIT